MPNLKLPGKNKLNIAISLFSKKEWIIFLIFLATLVISTLIILQTINKSFMVAVPVHGGSLSEGIVGTPRFINPILATSIVDQSMVNLVYSGLMRKDPDGHLIPDLAESYEVSPNGLIYTFTLKDGLSFHDKVPVSADDVVFTINTIKDVQVKSPHKVDWDGVSVVAIDSKTIQFTLRQPYASFLENATIGIAPQHLWAGSPIELNNTNVNPIGTGPYMISESNKQSSGIIKAYKLLAFEKFAIKKPFIKNLNLYFYQNEDELVKALENKQIEQISSITPLNAENLKELNFQIESSVLPRVFGLFFNQNQNQFFIDKAVVTAIDRAIDKEKLVRDVLLGYGSAIDGPIPKNMIEYQKLTSSENPSREELLEDIQEDLAKAGWKIGESGFLEKTAKDKKVTVLSFSISTGNATELAKAAELIKDDLSEIGMQVDVKTFDIGNLNQNVIRPRKYDALLFGQIINHESDLFAFWHSSQRKDPGLNVAMYTNTKVDKILEDAFVTVDNEARIQKYIQFEDEVRKDMPAIFLYSPDFTYIVSKNLKQFKMNDIISPVDRYLNAYLWYTDTENVWKVFAK